MRIPIKRLAHCFHLPEYHSVGAAGADVYATEDMEIAPGDRMKMPSGFCLELPYGHTAFILPRSGIAFKLGMVAITGTIDSDYRGEVGIVIHNVSRFKVAVARGDRIAQLVVQPVVTAWFVENDELHETTRGEKGFGSTGT
jgi:dUTP pyrophosphatase